MENKTNEIFLNNDACNNRPKIIENYLNKIKLNKYLGFISEEQLSEIERRANQIEKQFNICNKLLKIIED